MKEITVIDSKNKLTNLDIGLLEKKLGIKLPIEYKHFLLLHNGGHPKKDCYTSIGSTTISSDLDMFLAFHDGEYSNLLKEYLRFEWRIPKGFLPVAHDSGGNIICLGVNESEYSKVYFWEFDYAVPYGEEPTFDNMYLLANNFVDFINSLYTFDIESNVNSNRLFIYKYDQYSLSLSSELKKYKNINVIKNFFTQAPKEVEDYIIEETEFAKDLLLRYEVKSTGKKYYRKISENGKIEDYHE